MTANFVISLAQVLYKRCVDLKSAWYEVTFYNICKEKNLKAVP